MKRRGNPLEKTAWTPEMVRKFIRFQSAMLAAQRIQPDRIGGWAYELPSKSDDGEPAPLPDVVLQYLENKELSGTYHIRRATCCDFPAVFLLDSLAA